MNLMLLCKRLITICLSHLLKQEIAGRSSGTLTTQNVKHSRLTYWEWGIGHITLITSLSRQSNATSTITDTMNLTRLVLGLRAVDGWAIAQCASACNCQSSRLPSDTCMRAEVFIQWINSCARTSAITSRLRLFLLNTQFLFNPPKFCESPITTLLSLSQSSIHLP